MPVLALLACGACGAGEGLEPGPAPRIVWQTSGRGGPAPALDATTVYFGGPARDVTAVEKNTGRVRWHQMWGVSPGLTKGLNTVIVSDVVVLGDGGLFAFDRQTGTPRWTYAPADGDAPGLLDLASDGQTVYTGSLRGRIYAVDGATGAPRWITTLVPPGDSMFAAFNPVVREGVVFVGLKRFSKPYTGGLAALDAATGAVRWVREFVPEPANLGSGCIGDAVFFGATVIASAEDGRIYALDRGTGEVRWIAPAVHDPSRPAGAVFSDIRPLTVAGTMLVAGSTTGYLSAYDAATGGERWSATAGRGAAIYPLATDGQRVFAEHIGGQLAAFDAATGALLWRAGETSGEGEFFAFPVVEGERLYIGGQHGLYALRTN